MQDALGRIDSVLVLGGGSEIALATVERLVERGARSVVLGGRRPDALAEPAARLRERGAAVEFAEFDATKVDGHAALIDELFDRAGDIDVVILAFGVLGDQQQFEENPAVAAEAITTNFTATVSCGLAAARRLAAQGHGVLVVLSSVAGQRPRRDNYVYGSSKAGVDFFARGLAGSLRGSGARVLIVRPGFVHTKMTAGLPRRPFAISAERAAADIVAGIEGRRSVVWSPPLMRWVFLILRALPESIFRRVAR